MQCMHRNVWCIPSAHGSQLCVCVRNIEGLSQIEVTACGESIGVESRSMLYRCQHSLAYPACLPWSCWARQRGMPTRRHVLNMCGVLSACWTYCSGYRSVLVCLQAWTRDVIGNRNRRGSASIACVCGVVVMAVTKQCEGLSDAAAGERLPERFSAMTAGQQTCSKLALRLRG